jgi:DNA-binding beta-propeller fold protein YncE
MTSVDSNLFVLRYPSKQQIQVYDGTFIQSRPLQVGGLSDESNYGGLTSCATNNCLYVSDCWKDTVYRVDLLDKSIIRWQVEREPFGLSVSNVCNLLVACHDADKIQEYTSRGSLVREILLQSNDGDFSPWHAVQLTGDQFVVGSENDVAEVDTQGRVIVSYTNQLQSTSQQNFHDPRHLSVDKNLKHILVADCSNNRVMILNRSLKSCARELTATSLDVGLCQPSCLYFDELKNRLFVGEYRGQCRILVFENVI